MLESFQKLKESTQKLAEQTTRSKPVQTPRQHAIEDTYLRFKELHEALKKDPDHPLTKDLKHLAQELFQNKDFMKSLQQQQAQEAKFI